MSWRQAKTYADFNKKHEWGESFLKERAQAYKYPIHKWDWSELDKIFKPLLDLTAESIAVVQPLPDKKTFKVRALKSSKRRTGPGYDQAPKMEIPELIVIHTHVRTTKKVFNLPYPSATDLVAGIADEAETKAIWNVVYCAYGKVIWRPTKKLMIHIKKQPEDYIYRFGKALTDQYDDLTTKGLNPQLFIQYARAIKFEAYYLPFVGEKPVTTITVYRGIGDDMKDRYSGLPRILLFN